MLNFEFSLRKFQNLNFHFNNLIKQNYPNSNIIITTYPYIYLSIVPNEKKRPEDLPIINFTPSTLLCCRMLGTWRVSLLIRALPVHFYPQLPCIDSHFLIQWKQQGKLKETIFYYISYVYITQESGNETSFLGNKKRSNNN